MASVKLPYRSRIMAYGSVGLLEDAGEPLVPQTINSASTTLPLDRQTVDGEARTSAVNLRFTSRPKRYTDLTVSYRSYDYDNRTPEFAMRQRVSYDNAPSAVAPAVETEPHSVTRGTFDADFKITPNGWTSAGIGYTDRGGQNPSHLRSNTDNVIRLTFDTIPPVVLGAHEIRARAAPRRGYRARGRGARSIGEQPKLRHSTSPIAIVTASP